MVSYGRSRTPWTQGLALGLKHKQLSLKLREVSERKQVGDAESMINEGASATGVSGFFGTKGEV